MGLSVSMRRTFFGQVAYFVSNARTMPDLLGDMAAVYNERNMAKGELLDIFAEQAKSEPLHRILEGYVPATELMLVEAGAAQGKPEVGLLSAVSMLKTKGELMTGIIKIGLIFVAMFTVLVASVLTMGSVMHKMRNEFAADLADDQFAGYTQSFLALANWTQSYLIWVLAILLILFVLSIVFMKRWVGARESDSVGGNVRFFLDRWYPVYGIYRSFESSGFLLSLSGLVQGGVTYQDALLRLSQRAGPWLSHHIDLMEIMGRSQMRASESLVISGLFAESVEDEIKIVGRSGSLEKAIPDLANRLVRKTIDGFEAFSKIVMFSLLGLVACYAVWTMLSMHDVQNVVVKSLSEQ